MERLVRVIKLDSQKTKFSRHFHDFKLCRYVCPECTYTSPIYESIIDHLLSHAAERSFQCIYGGCRKKEPNAEEFEAHLAWHVYSPQFVNPYRYGPRVDDLPATSELLSASKKYSHLKDGLLGRDTNTCNWVFGSNSEKIHETENTEKATTFDCQCCDMKCSDRAALYKHLISSHPEDERVCTLCMRAFQWEHEVRPPSIPVDMNFDFDCWACSRSFFCRPKERIMEDEGPCTECPVCQVPFFTTAATVYHIRIHHYNPALNCPIPLCYMYGNFFFTYYNEHMSQHFCYERYVCTICQRTFRKKSNADRHKCSRRALK